jgi:hypothetical protein
VSIKKFIKSKKTLYYLLTDFRNKFYNVIFNIKKILREKRFYKKNAYEKLRQLKNIHMGERCFIVATGPSLTIQDVEKLKNEVTFSMNSICLAFNETEWRPTYYGIQNVDVYNKFEKQIEKLDAKCIFVADVIAKQKKIPDNFYIFPLHLLDHKSYHKKYNTKFSDNSFAVVYDGFTITYSLIQIAAYMGFEEIYLLGADSNYSKNTSHHFKDYGIADPFYFTAGERMISAYKEAKNYTNNSNLKIFNATRGGMLEVFERVNLDKVLSKNKNKNKNSFDVNEKSI